jgi:hypothetical protein
LITLFEQDLVIFAQCHAENDRSHVLEAMNPLLSLTSLTPYIEHAAIPVSSRKISTLISHTHCMLNEPIVNLVSYIPVVFVLALNTSASTGT